MVTTATPRRRGRVPLSSIDSNVIGSLKKKNATLQSSSFGKQQKQFSTKTAKTPGTKRKKKSRQKNTLIVDTPQIELPYFKQQTEAIGQTAEVSVFEKAADIAAVADASILTQLSENLPKYAFGSSGVSYDSQQWETQQSEAFKTWLNHLFQPVPKIHAVGEEERCAEWNAALQLFNSHRMTLIRFAIEREVTEGRLAITPRGGRNILDEVYIQEKLSSLLLSYTSRWLQLGLEVVLAHHSDQIGHNNHNMTKESLKKVILEQVLSNPTIIQKYSAGKVNTASGHFEKLLRVELQQHTLIILLILVFFLDEAKIGKLLTVDPILFEKTSVVKSSQGMLVSLCQDCFAKQRSILNHLEYEGVSVSYIQEPLDEYDFNVRNFAVDLKDGVCLARMMDIVTNGSNILSSLRLPADSRQQKLYNVRLALAALRQLGVPNISDITPAHIVDAHQPRIIQLVWSTILFFELPEFRQEIIQYKASRLIQSQARRYLTMKKYHAALKGCIAMQSLFRGAKLRMKVRAMSFAAREIQKIWRGYDAKVWYGFNLLSIITVQSAARRFIACKRVSLMSTESNASIQIQRIWRGYNQKIRYGFSLMDIISIQSICRHFLALRRANTRLRCVIKIQSAARMWLAKRTVAMYRNAAAKIKSAVRKSIAMQYVAAQTEKLTIDSDIQYFNDGYSYSSDDDSDEGEVIYYSTNQARRGCDSDKVALIRFVEREAECSFNDDIGESSMEEDGMSVNMQSSSMSEDLDLAVEIEHELASMVIQRHWRRYLCTKRYAATKKAVIMCQSIYRRRIAGIKFHNMRVARSRECASVRISSHYRGHLCRIKYLNSLEAVSMMQKSVRMFIAKMRVEEEKCFQIFLLWNKSAKKIQAQFRRHLCQSTYTTIRAGVVQLQARIRSVKKLALLKARAATRIQKSYRSWCATFAYHTQKRAALIIQSTFRRFFFRKRYRLLRQASTLIQSVVRKRKTRKSYLLHLNAVRIMQRGWRKFLEVMRATEEAATNIQRVWRGYSSNIDYMLLVLATIKIQAFARMYSARAKYRNTIDGIVLVQACLRGKGARVTIISQQKSSVILQRAGRGFLARIRRKKQYAAICIIQRAVRELIDRSRLKLRSCILIQKAGRGFLSRAHKTNCIASVIIIQHATRAMIARSQNQLKMFAAIEIQRVWRGYVVHIDYMVKIIAAMEIQSKFREFSAKKALLIRSTQHACIVIIQRLGRGFLARNHTKRIRSAAVVIQNAVRKMVLRSRNDSARNVAANEIQRVWRGFSAHVDYMLKVMAAIKIQSAMRRLLMKKKFLDQANVNRVVQEKIIVVDRVANEGIKASLPKHVDYTERFELPLQELVNSPPRVIDAIVHESNSSQEALIPKYITTSSHAKELADSPPRVIDVIVHQCNSSQEALIPKCITTSSHVSTPKKINVRSLSKYEKHSAKAIKVLRKSEEFLDIMSAVSTLKKTTSRSEDSCELLLRASAQDRLLSLLARCNRSTPHVELVCNILQVFANISSHDKFLSMLVTKDSVTILTDVVQMFRDKTDIFELSTSLLEALVQNHAFVLPEHSSCEQRKCLRGILSLSRKRAAKRSCPKYDKGIVFLENVLRVVDLWPHCNIEFNE